MSKRKVAILCSGGDSQGMNAAIHGCYKVIANKSHLEVFGIKYGYQGLMELNRQGKNDREYIGAPSDLNNKGVYFLRLDDASVSPYRLLSGSFLGSDRCPEFEKPENRREAAKMLREKDVDILVVIGGNGSFTGAALFAYENHFPVIGIPGTIDNDIVGTDYSIGLDTARTVAREAVRNVIDTMSAFRRIGLVEVMGRDNGSIALDAAAGAGADFVVIPERNQFFTYEKFCRLCRLITRNLLAETVRSICIVMAEGVRCVEDDGKKTPWLDKCFENETGILLGQTKTNFSLVQKFAPLLQKKVRESLAELDEEKLNEYQLGNAKNKIEQVKKWGAKIEVREVNLSHIQRGGYPTVLDVTTASRMGATAGLAIIESLNDSRTFQDWDPDNVLNSRFPNGAFKPIGISFLKGSIRLRPLPMMIKEDVSAVTEEFRKDYAQYQSQILEESKEKKRRTLRDYEFFKYASRVHPLKGSIID